MKHLLNIIIIRLSKWIRNDIMQPNQTLPIRAVAVGRARRGRQHGLDDARRHQGGLRSQRPGRLHRAALQVCIKVANL